MSELRDRLERLAARGTRRGADDVLGAARRDVPNGEGVGVTEFEGPDLPRADDDVLPIVTADPETRRRGRFGTVVAAFGIAALLGVGMLAITAMFGNGGADSPEGAVRQLADAVSHKDPLAAVDVLSPTEVRAARQTVNDAIQRAADLKLVDDASAPFAGVDLSVDHLELSTQSLADGYAKVTVTSGEISTNTHTAAMSKLLQDAIGDEGTSPSKINLARVEEGSGLPTFVITVRHDGRWYVSPVYTALEYARESADGPSAEFGSAKAAANGSDTPDDAVSDALHAWQARDWNRLMAMAPPDELPVYDYRNWMNQLAADAHPNFTIDKLSTTSDVNGDTATVKIEASGTMNTGSDKGQWQVGGACPERSTNWYGYGFSDDVDSSFDSGAESAGPISICVAGDIPLMVPFGVFGDTSTSGVSSGGAVTVEAVRENGRWFLSPVTTALQMLDETIEKVDQRSVYNLLGLAYQLPPDGTVTLGQPFTPPSDTGLLNTSVYTFEGTKGQQVVGEIRAGTNYSSATAQLYTADGNDVAYVDFSTIKGGYAYPVTLPVTGSYRLVVNGPLYTGATLTLWDTDDAPKGLIGSDSESCTTSGRSQSCVSYGDDVASVGSSELCTRAAPGVTCSFSESPTPLEGNRATTETPSPVTPTSAAGVATTVP